MSLIPPTHSIEFLTFVNVWYYSEITQVNKTSHELHRCRSTALRMMASVLISYDDRFFVGWHLFVLFFCDILCVHVLFFFSFFFLVLNIWSRTFIDLLNRTRFIFHVFIISTNKILVAFCLYAQGLYKKIHMLESRAGTRVSCPQSMICQHTAHPESIRLVQK